MKNAPRRDIRKFSRRVAGLVLLLATPVAAQEDLCRLAELHGAPGREQAVAHYVRERLGAQAEIDNTGSVSITFGSGGPQTLLVAGLDEPGYIVSGITTDGYLRLQRLTDPVPHYQFDTFFQGWPVVVSTRAGKQIPGVVAAPSVHFDGNSSAGRGIENLYVDLGAASREEIAAAGVSVLDAVTLDRQCVSLGERGETTAAWISSRAGAAVLLQLAALFERSPPRAAVTLAFVSRQYFHNTGLQRVLTRVPAQRVILFRAGGSEAASIGAPSGESAELAAELMKRAETEGIELRRSDFSAPLVGPFGPKKVWRNEQQIAVIAPAVRYAGTPVEVVDRQELTQLARLLAGFLEIGWRDQPSRAIAPARVAAAPPAAPAASTAAQLSAFAKQIEQLSEIYGVSGAERGIRAFLQKQLPDWARDRSSVDDKGNLIVRLGRGGNPRAIFIAHMDEIGFEITRDAADREVSAESRGGGMADVFAWHPFWVHTTGVKLPAVMTRHGSIDVGARLENADAVAVGDTATVRKDFRMLLGHRMTARSLDDRVGCAILLSTLQSMSAAEVRRLNESSPVWIVFSVEEESGLNGARHIAEQTQPRRVYAIDSFVTSDSPLEEDRMANARLGEGFVLRAMDSSGIMPADAVDQVVQLAQRHKIAHQVGVTAGGNDGSTFVAGGAVNIPLSFPLRYAHTPGEVADLRDAEALRKIVAALLETELVQAN